MLKKLSALALGLTLSMTAMAGNPPPTIKADAPNRYVVKKGDTLWAISKRYLDAPTRWREIWATNQQIKNPNLIYPNDVLILCVIKGQTLVGIDTGLGCAGVEEAMAEPADTDADANTAAASVPSAVPPRSAQIRTENYIPSIPLSNIRSWLTYSVVVGLDDFDNTPYVLASKNGNLITSVGDKIYARGTPLIVGQRYGIYRREKPYVDTTTGQVIGLEATQVAAGIVTSVSKDGISSIEIRESLGGEINEGDRVFIEVDAPVPPVFYPAPANVGRGGLILRTMNGMNERAAAGDVVAINLGTADGARSGQVLDVYKKGKLVRDVYHDNDRVRLPSELTGQLMIFKAFNRVSYAYVLGADTALEVGDRLLPPEF